MVTYKIRVNRPCRLFLDDKEIAILDELKLTKFELPEGEYFRKVVAIDNSLIYDEAIIALTGTSKAEDVVLDVNGLSQAKYEVLPKGKFCVGDFEFSKTEKGIGINFVKCVNRDIRELIIPSQIMYSHYVYPVVSVESVVGSFHRLDIILSDCKIDSIVIPNSVTYIDVHCLLGYKLKSIKVNIGNPKYDSRNDCNAIIETETNTLIVGCANTIIPDSVTSIGEDAFSWCNIENICIPNSVTTIGARAFEFCFSLFSIEIPNSVTTIGKAVFKGSALKSIVIPESVIHIGEDAFEGCYLESITVNIGNPIYDSRNDCNAIIETETNTLIIGCANTIIPNSVTGIGNGAFKDCDALKSIVIPESVIHIGEGAFEDCDALKSIIIPNSVIEISACAFRYCKSLESIVIPSSVISIGEEAFLACKALTSIHIPDGVINIERRAFQWCVKLVSVELSASVKKIGEVVFCSCHSLESIKIDSRNSIYDSRNDCNAIIETETNTLIRGCQNTIIPDDIAKIHRHAFCGSKALTSIIIPSSINYIGEDVFNQCDSLKSIQYLGTIEQWESIKKDFEFNLDSISISCIDDFIGESDEDDTYYEFDSYDDISDPLDAFEGDEGLYNEWLYG